MPEGTNRYAPPASVRGPSLRDVRAQRKADKEVEELLQSESPHAGAKAFALGLTSGAALSYGAAAPVLVAGVTQAHAGEVQRAQLAHWLTSRGMDADSAHRSTAGLQNFLSQRAPGRGAEEAARNFMAGGFRIEGVPKTYSTREKAESILKHLGEKGKGRGISEVAGVAAPGPRAADLFPSTSGAQRVLEAARESFEAAGKKAPGMGRAIGTVAKRHAPWAAMAGLIAGLGNVALTRTRRRELKELRSHAGEHP